jgi:hypothetical protein
MAGQGYGLLIDDIRILRDMIRWWRGRGGSRRPVPTRRRNRSGGGGGGTPTTYVHIIDTIPGKTRKQQCAEIWEFDADPSVLDWAPVYVNPEALPEDEDYQVITKIGIINFGERTIRGSDEIPIPYSGVDIISTTEAAEDDESPEPELLPFRYLIVTPSDLADHPGTELTTVDGKPQGPSKPNDSRHFYNDGGPCKVETP